MVDVQPIPGLLLFVTLVLCAWAYPRLNHWVYRRRMAHDVAVAARVAADPVTQRRPPATRRRG